MGQGVGQIDPAAIEVDVEARVADEAEQCHPGLAGQVDRASVAFNPARLMPSMSGEPAMIPSVSPHVDARDARPLADLDHDSAPTG